MTLKYTPHDKLTAGYWYLRTQYQPFYTIVYIHEEINTLNALELSVFMLDEIGSKYPEDFSVDQFISKVPVPKAPLTEKEANKISLTDWYVSAEQIKFGREVLERNDWDFSYRKRGNKQYITIKYDNPRGMFAPAFNKVTALVQSVFQKAYLTSGGGKSYTFRINP